MRQLFNYTAIEKLLQFSTSMALVMVVAKVLSPTDYAVWSIGLGTFLGIAPLLALMPTEVLSRDLDRRVGPFRDTRAMLMSVVCRSAAAAIVTLGSLIALQSSMAPAALSVVGTLLSLAAFTEICGFATALSIRQGAFRALMIGRAAAMAIKAMVIVFLLNDGQPDLGWIAWAYMVDSAVFVCICLYLTHLAGQVRLRAMGRYLAANRWRVTLGHCLRLFLISAPAIATLTLYNFALRSDRFVLAQLDRPTALQEQTICMQFVDPLLLVFCGYLINLHLHGNRLDQRLRKRYLLVLLGITSIAALAGPSLLAIAPENIAVASGRLPFLVWLLPAYGGFAMLFWSAFYGSGTRLAALRGFGFVGLSLGLPWALDRLWGAAAIPWTAPMMAAAVVFWVMTAK